MVSKNAFVTGGTGFVGANLVAGLNERGIEPRVLHRASSKLGALEGLAFQSVVGDVMDEPVALAEAMNGCDWVFHVGAVSDYWRQENGRLYEVNVEGTRRMLAAAAQAGVSRFVFTSSMAALGMPPEGKPMNESNRFNLNPERWPYAHSKHLAELEVLGANEAGLPCVIVNPSVVLGPRDVNVGSGSLVIEAAKGTAWFYPPGGTNYVDVADVAEGHMAAAERGVPGQHYLLAGHNITYKEAFRTLNEVVGRRKPWLALPGPLMPLVAAGVDLARLFLGNRIPMDATQVRMSSRDYYVDGSKAANAFGLAPKPFRETVQRTFDWYKEKGYLS